LLIGGKRKDWERVKRVVLFGAGRYGERFVDKNGDFIKENFLFCDNDLTKQGKLLFGLKVISFCKLQRLYKEGDIGRIIITTAKIDEILEQSIQGHISEDDIYFYDIDKNTVKSAKEAHAYTVFSQDGEEVFLRDFFADKKEGFYVDIGAYDPFRFSNTAWAYQRGWKGINIEPNIEGYQKFLWSRRRDINLNCGISNKEEIITYFAFEEGAYNTFSKEDIVDDARVKRTYQIPTRRLDSIFEEYGVEKIDFLDIDVEGYELHVLYSNNWDLYRPTIVLCEQKTGIEDVIKSEIFEFMKQKGYEAVSKYNRTVIYKKAEDEE